MWLLNAATRELQSFEPDRIPQYAILSHTWGSPTEEISFQDLTGHRQWSSSTGPPETSPKVIGWKKLAGACHQTLEDGLLYIWIDTCCIDKSSTAELSEAINSMFTWYAAAQTCYAYLADVYCEPDFHYLGSPFRKSRWFTRGWTLQELLAPATLTFFDTRWTNVGTKETLCSLVSNITGIREKYLHTSTRVKWSPRLVLSKASVGERMSWAAGRETTRVEDRAYCLLGIFDIYMPMLYGEGHRAFARLQEHIMTVTDDCTLLAWNFRAGFESVGGSLKGPMPSYSHSILAPNPISFKYCRDLTVGRPPRFGWPSFSMGQRGLGFKGPVVRDTRHDNLIYAILACGQSPPEQPRPRSIPAASTLQLLAVPLVSAQLTEGTTDGGKHEYLRPRWCHPVLVSNNFVRKANVQDITIRRRPAEYDLESQPSAQLHFAMDFSIDISQAYPPTPLAGGRAVDFGDYHGDQGGRREHNPLGSVHYSKRRRLFQLSILGFHLLLEVHYKTANYGQPRLFTFDPEIDTRLYQTPQPLTLEDLQNWGRGPGTHESFMVPQRHTLDPGVEVELYSYKLGTSYSYELGIARGRKVVLGIAITRGATPSWDQLAELQSGFPASTELPITTIEVGAILYITTDQPSENSYFKERIATGKSHVRDPFLNTTPEDEEVEISPFALKWRQWINGPGGARTQHFEGESLEEPDKPESEDEEGTLYDSS